MTSDTLTGTDPYRTDPPQTLPFYPHDRMRYFGLSGGTECVRCMEPDCEKVIPFTRAAAHQAAHA